jgi:hypothetical protein
MFSSLVWSCMSSRGDAHAWWVSIDWLWSVATFPIAGPNTYVSLQWPLLVHLLGKFRGERGTNFLVHPVFHQRVMGGSTYINQNLAWDRISFQTIAKRSWWMSWINQIKICRTVSSLNEAKFALANFKVNRNTTHCSDGSFSGQSVVRGRSVWITAIKPVLIEIRQITDMISESNVNLQRISFVFLTKTNF